MMIEDMELVREYARCQSEEAFATLVSRYVNLVYSIAYRQVRDLHLAEEITQTVFVILAQKTGSLSSKTILSGWLCQTTRYASFRALTMQRRRQLREQEAYMQSQSTENEPSLWERIEPLLDAAMARLGEKDHHALALRFINGRSFREVGAALGTSEAGAKMRVNRALERLRNYFAKRGHALSVAAIAGAISANSVQAAPLGLATTITAGAVHGTALPTSTLTLIQTTLKLMSWTKIKTATAIGVVLLLAAGTATITIGRSRANAESSFTFSGYGTPEMAIRSTLWSASQGDLDKSLAGFTTDEAERFRAMMAGKSEEDVKRALTNWAQAMKGYQITGKDSISADEVHLHIHAIPSVDGLRNGKAIIVMKKLGNEWKQAGEVNR